MTRLVPSRLAAAALSVALAVAATGCEVIEGYRFCPDIPSDRAATLPATLTATGLHAGGAGEALAPGVRPYTPQFQLWSDGAVKRRWIRLPPGRPIDTSDMNSWQFPEGTKVWKEFTRDGVRVETRLLQKTGPGPEDWAPMAYLWNAEGTEAVAVPDGVFDAAGTGHEVPAARECMGCHGGRRSRLLGVSAVQLAPELAALAREGLLTAPPAAPPVVPGDDVTRGALGYLHANCSHCHNHDRPPAGPERCFDPRKTFDFSLDVEHLARVEDTAVYRTAIGAVIRPGDPDGSKVIQRMSARDRWGATMPPLGTELVDEKAVAALKAWIVRL